ncbi:MAG: mannose-1-phosphate guanylyltransferase [Lentisphaerae bacterium]|nr:mannose-1-phosphate guanylyltransferase [Lentisphaerota bacterium]
MSCATENLYAVVMAGGRGERFWPAGRSDCPKQLLKLYNDHTMIEESVQRLFPLVKPENILVITNVKYLRQMRNLLPLPPENIIGEPEGRDTAPCIALAAALVGRRNPHATMIMLPADHMIRPVKLFHETLLHAVEQAQTGALVTIGITPTSPATGYGYIHMGKRINEYCCRVESFKEKPDPATAQEFFADGNYRWNGGIFVWQQQTIRRAFRKFVPAMADKLANWQAGGDYTADFAQCEKISIDYAIMEKADHVLVVDALFQWNDIGSWNALRSVLPQDNSGNVMRGRVVAMDSNNNILLSDDETLLGVIGMHDCAIVKSGNGILVCPLSEEQRVKELVKVFHQDHTDFI